MKLKNQGFSLISVMVAAGVGLIAATALIQQMVNQARMIRHLESKLEANQLKQELALMLGDAANCDASFGGLTGLQVGNIGSDEYSDITSQLTGTSRPLSQLKSSYSQNNRFLNINEVRIFKPVNKLGGAPSNASPYEIKIKVIVQEKGGLEMIMQIDGPTIILNVTGGTIDAPDACVTGGGSAPFDVNLLTCNQRAHPGTITADQVCKNENGFCTGTRYFSSSLGEWAPRDCTYTQAGGSVHCCTF